MTDEQKGIFLKDVHFDFEMEDIGYNPHVAYTTASVGGAASGMNDPILLKAVDGKDAEKAAQEFLKGLESKAVEKADVTWELPFEKFLETCFGMWHYDAAALSLILGFESETYKEALHDLVNYDETWSFNAIQSRMQGVTINKAKKSLSEFVEPVSKGLDQFKVEVDLETFLKEFGQYLETYSAPESTNVNDHIPNTIEQAIADRMSNPLYAYTTMAVKAGIENGYENISKEDQCLIKAAYLGCQQILLAGESSKQETAPVGEISKTKEDTIMPKENEVDLQKSLDESAEVIKSLKSELETLKAEKAAKEEAELVAKASEFSFIGEEFGAAAGKLLKSLKSENLDVLLKIFAAAEEAISAKKAEKEEEVEEMLTTKSVEAEGEVEVDDIKSRVNAALKAKFKN